LGVGRIVRRAFGRYERFVSETYRSVFVHLDAFVGSVRTQVPAATEILEIGCGDGLVTERLALAFPDAALTGIDICAEPGRLYRGDPARVRFLRARSEALSTAEGARFQLIIIADVLHHVPVGNRAAFLSSVIPLMRQGATLVLKEWVREWTPAYALGYFSDRFITGDRIRYPDADELRVLVQSAFGQDTIRSEFRVRPWHCNLALVISPDTSRLITAAPHDIARPLPSA
jgi:2-polyprenyl-3-methyl-5-hydroxy-6-metoxy-1,4-benzoquinol methylase